MIFSANPRPPREWWKRMHRSIARQYKRLGKARIDQITAGIWWKLPESTRNRLVRRYDMAKKNPGAAEHTRLANSFDGLPREGKMNPLVGNLLAVARYTKFYKDLDSGEKDMLYARQIVQLHWKRGTSWAVSYPGMNTLLVPSKDLMAFKDPVAASKKYKAGEYWGTKNPGAVYHEIHARIHEDMRDREDRSSKAWQYHDGEYNAHLMSKLDSSDYKKNPNEIWVKTGFSKGSKVLISRKKHNNPTAAKSIIICPRCGATYTQTPTSKIGSCQKCGYIPNPRNPLLTPILGNLGSSIIAGIGLGAGFHVADKIRGKK